MNVYDPHIDFAGRTLVIAGLGGTGANVAARLGRILYAMKENGIRIPQLILVDPDVVEDRNIGRQLFLQGDVGLSKAVAVMRHLNAAYGLETVAIPEPIHRKHLYNSGIILGCVDGAAGRRTIHDYMITSYHGSCVWIDAGNDRESGQVVLGDYNRNGMALTNSAYSNIPIPSLIFPGLIEESVSIEQPLSCAELILRWEQDMLINDWMALVVAQYVKRLLLREPIHTFLTYVGSNALAVRSIPVDDLPAYLE